jgi:hypothetical protein
VIHGPAADQAAAEMDNRGPGSRQDKGVLDARHHSRIHWRWIHRKRWRFQNGCPSVGMTCQLPFSPSYIVQDRSTMRLRLASEASDSVSPSSNALHAPAFAEAEADAAPEDVLAEPATYPESEGKQVFNGEEPEPSAEFAIAE